MADFSESPSLLLSPAPPLPAIRIRGARQHNLQNVSLDLPKNKLIVITGVSGSGKSSLAFDTLYAEGQRRYVESLSTYARQYLNQLPKPDVDSIEGLSPAIAVEQRTGGGSPRSTIATATEIYDYLRVLWSAAGLPHDPATGEAIRRKTPAQIVEETLALGDGVKLMLLAPQVENAKGDHQPLLDKLRRQGLVRVRINGEMVELTEALKLPKTKPQTIEAVVDRLVAREGSRSRLTDSLEAALKLGRGEVRVLSENADGSWTVKRHTTALLNPETGFVLPELTPQHFSFNSRNGACPACEGLGTQLEFDADLFVPDPGKSLADGAVRLFWVKPKSLRALQEKELLAFAKRQGVEVNIPWRNLPIEFHEIILQGNSTSEPVKRSVNAKGARVSYPHSIKAGGTPALPSAPAREGLLPQAQRLYASSKSELTRVQLRRFMRAKPCPACHGQRLKPEILAVTLTSHGEEKNIEQCTRLSITQAIAWLAGLQLTDQQRFICHDVVREINARLKLLDTIGLPYLTLDRPTNTLSGGESQRIRLATQLGSGLSGVLYVLDEPSTGLHQSDNDRLLLSLKRLRDLGNTVVVVEHDEETMLAADYLVDIGPGAGAAGGQVLAAGTPAEVAADPASLTGAWLSGRSRVPIPARQTLPAKTHWLRITDARENNLRGIDAAFPLGRMTCVTGVSGSGKSTLVDDILRRAVFRHFFFSKIPAGQHGGITGLDYLDKAVVIDQEPIGRSPRSNPATFTGVFNPMRDLFAMLPMAKMRGYGAGRFSFNVAGGRCAKCEGGGLIHIEMHFLPDVYVTCDECQGRRYNAETLEVTFRGKSIADVLDMSVEEAAVFFKNNRGIFEKIYAMQETGLGYLKLGQAANTLSGGEAQRIKLAAELGKRSTGRTLYLLDEPTTGLHFQDVQVLLGVLTRLRDAGNTLIIIEHQLDVIKCADWVLDLGPGGGEAGGRLLAQGTPEEVAQCEESLTGKYLRKMLQGKG